MANWLNRLLPTALRERLQARAWIIAVLAILLSLTVRVRLADMPLERDEGEYAYIGQLILQGEPPYRDAYNMKLPGTYLAYSASMAIFGQTPTGIHLGLALVNAATIWLIFLLGKKLLDGAAGAVAAVTYALMSLSPDVLGLAGHATHYVALPAVGGILLLLKAIETRSFKYQLLAGLLFGLAFVMKQHGIFFGLCAGCYLIYVRWLSPKLDRGSARNPKWRRASGSKYRDVPRTNWVSLSKELGILTLGSAIPYLGICLWLWAAGVFPQFWFWTVTYGSQYATGLPLVKASDMITFTAQTMIGPNLVFWLLPWVGMLMMWWDERLDTNRRFLLTALLLASLASISVGFYFRQHYFILLLPVLALLIGVAVTRSLQLLGQPAGLELFLALGVLCVTALATGAVFVVNGGVWFTMTPKEAVERIYLTTVFGDAREAAKIIRDNTTPDTRIAVIGSEPEICFYAQRRSATGHIYTYALMETHPFAARMQEQMIEQIEAAQPEYVVYVQNDLSWLRRNESEQEIFVWWRKYWEEHLQLMRTFNTKQGVAEFAPKDPAPAGSSGNYLLLLKRKS